MTSDAELLRRYVRDVDQPAFTELVRRHVDLVYAAGLRRANGEHRVAEEATQHAFILLARHARRLVDHPTLTGWLYLTARHAAATQLRNQQARLRRETAAAMTPAPSSPPWNDLRPDLEQLIAQLDRRERDVLVLRFFEGRAFAEIGFALSISEDAARMRVERALEKIRATLARRGITSTAAALSATLGSVPAVAAPGGLAAAAAAAALAAPPVGAGVAVFMSSSKVVPVSLALLVVGGIGFTAHRYATHASLRAAAGSAQPGKAAAGSRTLPPAHDSAAKAAPSEAATLPSETVAPATEAPRGASVPGATTGPWLRGMVPASDWRNRTPTTPDAALESYLWAGDHVDVDARARVLGFGALKPEVDAFFARLPAAIRDQYGTPEKLWAEMLAGAPQGPAVVAYDLLYQTPNPVLDATTVTLHVRTVKAGGITEEGDMTFERSRSGWRRTLPPSLVTPVFNLFPSAKPPVAAAPPGGSVDQ